MKQGKKKIRKLSVIVPVYNERTTIPIILKRLENLKLVHWQLEIVIVDDGSIDGSRTFLQNIKRPFIRIILHKKNQGKGAAIRTGIKYSHGDYILIQDADLEYDPQDIHSLLIPINETDAPVVYGSRFKGKTHDSLLLHRQANFLLTLTTNFLYRSSLSDMETCYKLIRRDLVTSMKLTAKRFEFEPEITAKLLKRNLPIIEVPISYTKRGYSEGKKIGLTDFFEAVWVLIHCRFTSR